MQKERKGIDILEYVCIEVCFVVTYRSVGCIRVAKVAQKRRGPSAKLFSRNRRYFVAIFRCVAFYVLFG